MKGDVCQTGTVFEHLDENCALKGGKVSAYIDTFMQSTIFVPI